MKALLLIMVLCFMAALPSCTNANKKSELSDTDKKMIQRQELFEAESIKEMKDSTILLGIKLQCSEKDYKSKMRQLTKEKKIYQKNGYYWYIFDFGDGIKIAGKLLPNFRNGKLFKLDIKAEWENPNVILSSTVIFGHLNDLYKTKYNKWKDVMFVVSESYIYDHDWYGDGIHVSLRSDNISYSFAKEERAYYKELQENKNRHKNKTVNDI